MTYTAVTRGTQAADVTQAAAAQHMHLVHSFSHGEYCQGTSNMHPGLLCKCTDMTHADSCQLLGQGAGGGALLWRQKEAGGGIPGSSPWQTDLCQEKLLHICTR